MNAPEKTPSAAPVPAPEKQKPNDLLGRHGPAGRLIVALQRYALAGWIAFFSLLVFFILLVLISTFAPKPVIAVDESGRVLGTFEYLNASNRSNQEVLAAAKFFTQNYLSLNSDTIFDDYTEAMNMMAEDMYNASLGLVKEGYLSRIKAAGSRSTVRFVQNGGLEILSRQDLSATVRLKGNIEVRTASQNGTQTREQPFDLTLVMTAIPRTTLSTRGFRIDSMTDN